MRDERSQFLVRPVVAGGREVLGQLPRMACRSPAGAAECHRGDPERDCRDHPAGAEADPLVADECKAEDERPERADSEDCDGGARRAEE